jgi:two-component system phosphate regulon sensor histidine kinase PhoR
VIGWWVAGVLACALAGVSAWSWMRFVRPVRRLEALARDLAGVRTAELASDPVAGVERHLHQLFKQVEAHREQLANEAYHLQTILTGMQEGVMVVSPDLRVQLANPALQRIFQLDAPPVGRSLMEALRSHAVERVVRTALESGRTEDREIVLREDPSGVEAPFVTWVNAAALPGRDGGVRGVVVVLHDVSRLRELEQVRRDFVANTSHELRTPLAIFSGYIENMLDSGGMEWDEVRHTLLILQRHAERLNFLCNDLLTLTRLESGTMRLNRVPVMPGVLARSIVEELSESNTTRGLPLELDVEPETPVVNLDPTRIEQVLYNLVGNAAKYSPTGSPIRVKVRHDAARDEVQFSVTDHGPGIPPQHLAHIFERFYRVEKSRERGKGGTGLGLSIVKHVVLAHRGRVWAESEPGKGTTVTFAVPVD